MTLPYTIRFHFYTPVIGIIIAIDKGLKHVHVSIGIFYSKIFVRAPLHRSVKGLNDARLFIALRCKQLDIVMAKKLLNFSIEKFRSLVRLQTLWLSSTFKNDF